MNYSPLDSELIDQKEQRPLWQRMAIFIIGLIIVILSILIILNLIDIFHFLILQDQIRQP